MQSIVNRKSKTFNLVEVFKSYSLQAIVDRKSQIVIQHA